MPPAMQFNVLMGVSILLMCLSRWIAVRVYSAVVIYSTIFVALHYGRWFIVHRTILYVALHH